MNVITLGGLSLPPSLIWPERYAASQAAQSIRRTLGGNVILQARGLVKGRTITLISQEDSGWFTRVQVKALVDMANDPVGQYSLVFGVETFDVCFNHTSPPAVEFKALVPRVPDEDGDYYLGQLKLIEI